MKTTTQGKPEFKEDFISEKRDPTAPTFSQFDWDEVFRELGELSADDRASVAIVIRKIFLWVTDVKLNRRNTQKMVGRRFIALSWVLDPSLFEDSPSLEALGKKIGCQKLWMLSGQVTKDIGISNHGQDHAWNRAKADKNQTASPEKNKESFLGVKP